jgi:two-component system, cell cycle sensor histidine kinase and response regulator CckA
MGGEIVNELEPLQRKISELEQALRESEEYSDRLINSLGDPLFVQDPKNRFILANKAFSDFTGINPEKIIGNTATQFMPDELANSWREQDRILLETGEECVTQEAWPDKGGNIRTILIKRTLLRDRNGEKQILGVLRDITEYKLLEAQFLQSQKLVSLGALAGGVAHDFNNLLSVIRGYTELLMEEFNPKDQVRADLEQIEKAGQRASSLISQLLAFSHKQILQPETINLNDSVNEMAKMLRRMIGKDIEVSMIMRPDLSSIHADPGQIQQIIMNLAINARDAMPKGGKLAIETDNLFLGDVRRHPDMPKGDYVMLAVSDNGVGMDDATQARIFEPFFTTKGMKGAGLGLPTISRIVKQNNGFIWVNSELGKGSSFKICYPSVGEINSHSTQKNEPVGFETVLIAEDEASVCALAGRILRARGYTVLEASNGREALILAQQYPEKIDLVLADVIMPEVDGSTLVAQLKTARPDIKALYISGRTDNAIVHHGAPDTGVNFLQKPFSASGLERKVREVLDSPH